MIPFLLGLLLALLYTRRACRIAVENYIWKQKIFQLQADINAGRTPIYHEIATQELKLDIQEYLSGQTRLPAGEVERTTKHVMARILSRNPTWHK